MRTLIIASMAAGLLFLSVAPSFASLNLLSNVQQAKANLANEEGQDIPTPQPQPQPQPHPTKKGK